MTSTASQAKKARSDVDTQRHVPTLSACPKLVHERVLLHLSAKDLSGAAVACGARGGWVRGLDLLTTYAHPRSRRRRRASGPLPRRTRWR